MFHARIVSPRGSLYVAAEATPYDLENLRTHVHDLRAAASTDTRVELRIDRPSSNATYKRVSTFLQQLEAEGVQTSFSLSPLPASPLRSGVAPSFNGVARRGSAA
jgi:biopolymer transport protein ExbD